MERLASLLLEALGHHPAGKCDAVGEKKKPIFGKGEGKRKCQAKSKAKLLCDWEMFPRLTFISLWGYISAGCGILNRWHFCPTRNTRVDGLIEPVDDVLNSQKKCALWL